MQNASAVPPPRTDGCSSHERFFPIGGGGVLALSQGAVLRVPRGSLDEATVLWGEVCSFTDEDGLPVTYYQFGPSGTQFDPPATLELHYGVEFDEYEATQCYYWNEEAQEWEPVDSYHDAQRHRFVFEIDHFSLYAVSANRGEGEGTRLP